MSEGGLLNHPWIARRKLDTVEYHRMAAAGIREFWTVNLQTSEVEVCRDPQAGGDASIQRLGADAALEPEALPGVRLRLAEVLP